jgi:hypothetical protein
MEFKKIIKPVLKQILLENMRICSIVFGQPTFILTWNLKRKKYLTDNIRINLKTVLLIFPHLEFFVYPC